MNHISPDGGDKIRREQNDKKQDQCCHCDDLDSLEPDHDAKAENEDPQVDLH